MLLEAMAKLQCSVIICLLMVENVLLMEMEEMEEVEAEEVVLHNRLARVELVFSLEAAVQVDQNKKKHVITTAETEENTEAAVEEDIQAISISKVALVVLVAHTEGMAAVLQKMALYRVRMLELIHVDWVLNLWELEMLVLLEIKVAAVAADTEGMEETEE